jgi:hypothetical protein
MDLGAAVLVVGDGLRADAALRSQKFRYQRHHGDCTQHLELRVEGPILRVEGRKLSVH